MDSPVKLLPSAWENRDAILKQCSGKRIALFLDFDGTLTPIVDRPDDAVLGADARDLLGALAERFPVVIVSGRDIADLRGRIGLDGIYYAGGHGFTISSPGGHQFRHEIEAPVRQALDEATDRLRGELKPIDGILIEEKDDSVAVHYRLVPDDSVGKVVEAVERVSGDLPLLRVTRGKQVLELMPALDWNKGEAVLWLLGILGLDGADALPLYIGDDITDEDAFRVLAGRGISVCVGERAHLDHVDVSAADFSLADPVEVLSFLGALKR